MKCTILTLMPVKNPGSSEIANQTSQHFQFGHQRSSRSRDEVPQPLQCWFHQAEHRKMRFAPSTIGTCMYICSSSINTNAV